MSHQDNNDYSRHDNVNRNSISKPDSTSRGRKRNRWGHHSGGHGADRHRASWSFSRGESDGDAHRRREDREKQSRHQNERNSGRNESMTAAAATTETATRGISDQEALQALFASATRDEKEGPPTKRRGDGGGGRHHDHAHGAGRKADETNSTSRNRTTSRHSNNEGHFQVRHSRHHRGEEGFRGKSHGDGGRYSRNDEGSYYGPRREERNQQQRRQHQPQEQQHGPSGPALVEDYDGTHRSSSTKEGAGPGATEEEKEVEKEKPNFGLSGALAQYSNGGECKGTGGGGGNTYKGVALKFREPPEARAPNTLWRLYVFRKKTDAAASGSTHGDCDPIETLHISRQSAFLLGRQEDIADIPLRHPSCSSQHAVIQYRALPVREQNPIPGRGAPRLNCQPYLMDLESTNGSFLNGVQIDPARYYQLKKGDVLSFGASTREYVVMK